MVQQVIYNSKSKIVLRVILFWHPNIDAHSERPQNLLHSEPNGFSKDVNSVTDLKAQNHWLNPCEIHNIHRKDDNV